MAVVTLPQHSQLPGDKMSPPHRSMENSKRHAPRPKSILKSNRRPSQQELRPLNRALTDSFPIELIKIVLDALQYDRDAMRSCTLVCRSWLRMCREYYKPDITVHPGNASRFLDLISSPYVSITDSIRHLTIHKQFNVVDHCFLVNSPQTSPTLSRPFLLPKPLQLPDILSRATAFPYLNKLTLQKGYGESSAIASSLREFHYLQELELRSFEFVSFSDLAAVISAQPNIQRLSLTDIAWGIRNASPSTTGTSTSVLPNLRHLELFMEKQAVLFNWILARPSIPNIEYVELGGITELDDAIAVSRFLRGLGPVLKHLRLYSPNRISQGERVQVAHSSQSRGILTTGFTCLCSQPRAQHQSRVPHHQSSAHRIERTKGQVRSYRLGPR